MWKNFKKRVSPNWMVIVCDENGDLQLNLTRFSKIFNVEISEILNAVDKVQSNKSKVK